MQTSYPSIPSDDGVILNSRDEIDVCAGNGVARLADPSIDGFAGRRGPRIRDARLDKTECSLRLWFALARRIVRKP